MLVVTINGSGNLVLKWHVDRRGPQRSVANGYISLTVDEGLCCRIKVEHIDNAA